MKSILSSANGIREALKKHKNSVLLVSRKNRKAEELCSLAKQYGIKVKNVSDNEIIKLVGHQKFRGYALEIYEQAKSGTKKSIESLWLEYDAENTAVSPLVIVLDGITDTGNLGAVLRSADQFEAAAVIIPKRRSAGTERDSLSRSSAGAAEWVSLIEVPNLPRALDELKEHGFWVWGADMDGESADKVNLKGPVVLVLGREGEGLHRLVKEKCDGIIKIPSGGNIDSLNVSVAAGILMYETRRQQKFIFSGK